MGVFEHLSSGRRITLRSQHLVGRSRVCHLRLPDPEVSGTHAMLAWIDERWTVRDLGSTNGSWIESAKLTDREYVDLPLGAVVAFGTTTNRWRLLSSAPPSATAFSLETEDEVTSDHEMLALPHAEAPEAVIFLDGHDRWRLEHNGEVRTVSDLEVIEVAGQRWRLHLPDELEGTAVHGAVRPVLSNLTLRFKVSAHEESVELTALHRDEVIDLGSYSHNHVLLYLARQFQNDRERGITDPAEQGWCYPDEVNAALRLKGTNLNVAIHRARRQLSRQKIDGAVDVVERRPSSHQLRLGTGRFLIE